MTGFCREFIYKYAEIVEPMEKFLTGETKKSIKTIKWDDEGLKSFKDIKDRVMNNTERSMPDPEKEFVLITDASNTAIGAILSQVDEQGKRKMISKFSKKLDSAQRNYSTTDKELLAIIKSCEHYRHYLIGKKFKLETDHKALSYLHTCKNPSSRLLRWSLKLQEFKFETAYIRGEDNAADGFSRIAEINAINQDSRRSIRDPLVRTKILEAYHRLSGHGSINNIKFLLKEKYAWDGMFKDIEKLVVNCEICAKAGPERVNTKNRIIESRRPNEIWEIDLIGRIPDGKINLFVVTAIDHYSKFLETKIVADKSAETILEVIKEIIIEKHGIPDKIITDNWLEFVNGKIQEFANQYGIDWNYSSPYHHNTVGP